MHMESKRKYRVIEVRKVGAHQEMFNMSSGEAISVKDYFAREKKNVLK